MFGNLKQDPTIQEAGDVLGGGGVLDTDIHKMVVEMAYADKSAGGALSLNLSFKGSNGTSLRTTFWVTSGTAKGGHNYYVDKQGNKQFLPGYSQANALCLLTVGEELANVAPETKTIGIYDYDLKKEVPKQREVLMPLIGQEVSLGVIRQIVDKNVKNDAGIYVPSGETREENEIDKIFRASDGMTVVEIRAEATEAVFYNKWLEKNKGVVRNKAKGAVAGNAGGQPAADTPAEPAKKLF